MSYSLGAAITELGVSGWVMDGDPSNEAEFNSMFRKITATNSNGEHTFSSDPSDFGVTWAQASAKRTELNNAEPLRLLRQERNAKLAETDHWDASDTPAMTQAQIDYRQALRDITDNYSDLDTVVWPTKP